MAQPMPLASFPRHYAALRAADGALGGSGDAFDNHCLASILAMALGERDGGLGTLADGLGLSPDEIVRLVDLRFPGYRLDRLALDRHPLPRRELEEDLLRDLLLDNLSGDATVSRWMATLVARRSMRPDHLWQDLGLRCRDELGDLLKRHFLPLHAANTRNMRWKRFFYRRLCEAEGFVLCTAPSCSVCADFAACFDGEDGLSQLARLRLQSDEAA